VFPLNCPFSSVHPLSSSSSFYIDGRYPSHPPIVPRQAHGRPSQPTLFFLFFFPSSSHAGFLASCACFFLFPLDSFSRLFRLLRDNYPRPAVGVFYSVMYLIPLLCAVPSFFCILLQYPQRCLPPDPHDGSGIRCQPLLVILSFSSVGLYLPFFRRTSSIGITTLTKSQVPPNSPFLTLRNAPGGAATLSGLLFFPSFLHVRSLEAAHGHRLYVVHGFSPDVQTRVFCFSWPLVESMCLPPFQQGRPWEFQFWLEWFEFRDSS